MTAQKKTETNSEKCHSPQTIIAMKYLPDVVCDVTVTKSGIDSSVAVAFA